MSLGRHDRGTSHGAAERRAPNADPTVIQYISNRCYNLGNSYFIGVEFLFATFVLLPSSPLKKVDTLQAASHRLSMSRRCIDYRNWCNEQ